MGGRQRLGSKRKCPDKHGGAILARKMHEIVALVLSDLLSQHARLKGEKEENETYEKPGSGSGQGAEYSQQILGK